MIMRGYMKVRNCMVIVWLLYGYCVVRMGKNSFTRGARNLKDPDQTIHRFIFCKDTNKFSNFQIFRGDNFQKSALIVIYHNCQHASIASSFYTYVPVHARTRI